MSWSFINPLLLAGLAGAALPTIIHLIGRRRAPIVRFAAFDFLFAVNRRLARWERIRQVLLLVLRTLVVMAIVFAVARPTRSHSVVEPYTSKKIAIIFDHSRSMSYELEGETLLSRGKKAARDLLSRMRPGDAVALVIAGPQPRSPFKAPHADLAAVRRTIDTLEVSDGAADMGSAIDTALAQLGDAAAGAELVIVSDLAKNGFAAIRPTHLSPAPTIRLVDAAGRDQAEPLPNLAIEEVRVARSTDSASERVLTVAVRNFGTTAIKQRLLELRVDGQLRQQSFLSIGARATGEKKLTVRFDGTGVRRCEVRLSESELDGYADDDSYRFQVELTKSVRVLAINGDPRTIPYEDELFFVGRALHSVPDGRAPIELSIVTVDEFSSAGTAVDLPGFDAVLLANVGDLPEQSVSDLQDAVGNGLGAILVLGPRVDFEDANRSLANLLPTTLRDMYKAEDEIVGAPPLKIEALDHDHPIFRGLDEAFHLGIRGSETSRYFNVDVGTSQRARTLLRFENGAPALLEREGKSGGRVLMFTTALDVDMGNLVLTSAFPALIQRSIRYAAGALNTHSLAPVRAVGRTIVPLPTGARAISFHSPSGERVQYTPTEENPRTIEAVSLREVGFYSAEVGYEHWQRQPSLDIAVNSSLSESDFTTENAQAISKSLGSSDPAARVDVSLGLNPRSNPFEQRGPATYLLLAFAAFFIFESVLASRG